MLIFYIVGILIGGIAADWRAAAIEASTATAAEPHPWLAFMVDDLDECDAPTTTAAATAAISSRCETEWSGASATTEEAGH